MQPPPPPPAWKGPRGGPAGPTGLRGAPPPNPGKRNCPLTATVARQRTAAKPTKVFIVKLEKKQKVNILLIPLHMYFISFKPVFQCSNELKFIKLFVTDSYFINCWFSIGNLSNLARNIWFKYSYLNSDIIMATKKVFEGRRERKGLDFFRSD